MGTVNKNNFETIGDHALKVLKTLNKEIVGDCTVIEKEITDFTKEGNKIINENSVLRIGIVGQVKAGKSSFLNSLFFNGEDILPKAATPMTAGLVILQYAEENYFEIEYYSKEDWRIFEMQNEQFKKIVEDGMSLKKDSSKQEIMEISKNQYPELATAHQFIEDTSSFVLEKIIKSEKEKVKFASISEIQGQLRKYVGADGEYTNVVKSIVLCLNDQRLKNIQIVDTPGVNDPIVSREMKTKEMLRSCHGVFFLSSSSRFFDSEDQRFLNNRIGKQGIRAVVMLASKYDSVLQDVGMDYDGDLPSADKITQEKLKKQFRTQLDTMGFNFNEITFDVISGIGYGIGNKEEHRLDGTEKNVLGQMRMFYPDYFTNYEDAQETFIAISNLEGIRSKYLDGIFREKRDIIIKDKIEGYFNNINGIKECIGSLENNLKNDIDILNQTDKEDLVRLKENLAVFNDEITSDIKYFIDNIITELSILINEFNVSISKKIFTKIPFSHVRKEVIVERGDGVLNNITDFFSEKKIEIAYEQIDQDQLSNNVKELSAIVSREAKQFFNSTNEKRDGLYNFGLELINNITKKELGGQNRILSRVLRDILEKVNNEIKKIVKLNFEDIFEELTIDLREMCTRINTKIESVVSNNQGYRTESELSDIIKEEIKKIEYLDFKFLSNVEGVCKKNIVTKMKVCNESYIKIYSKMKEDFTGNFMHHGNEEIGKINKELDDKERALYQKKIELEKILKLKEIYN